MTQMNESPRRFRARRDTLRKLTGDIGKLTLLQLRLPEDGVRIAETMLDPAILLDMVEINKATRIRIAMRSREDASPSQLEGVLILEIIRVLGVEDAVGESLAGADAEQVAGEAGAVRVDVVEGGAFLGGDAGDHGAHGEAHALV